MRQKQDDQRAVEKTVRDIKRRTRRKFGPEDKIRIVLQGLRGEDSIAELCRREGLHQNPPSGVMSLPARSAMIWIPLPASANPQAGPEDIRPTPQRGEDVIGGGVAVEQIDAPAKSRRVMAREGRRATGVDRMRRPMRPTGAPAASCGCDLARAGPPGTGRAHARRRDARLPCR